MKIKFGRVELLYGLKISGAAIVAILLANALGLDFAVSAGIVAILSVAPTKRETIKTAMNRLFAFLVALGLSFVCFCILGVNGNAFFVYLLFFIPFCLAFRLNSAMAMDSVLISHFLSFGVMNGETIYNEVMIFVIGVSLGIFVNLHLKKRVWYLDFLKEQMDEQIKKELHRMALKITQHELENYDGSCFESMWMAVYKAKEIARENYQNDLTGNNQADLSYIDMREKQIDVLHQMFRIIISMHTAPYTAQMISDFLERIAGEYHSDNSCEELLEEFHDIQNQMKRTTLPQNREEFEDRAQLYGLLCKIEEFLLIKNQYYKEQ